MDGNLDYANRLAERLLSEALASAGRAEIGPSTMAEYLQAHVSAAVSVYAARVHAEAVVAGGVEAASSLRVAMREVANAIHGRSEHGSCVAREVQELAASQRDTAEALRALVRSIHEKRD